MKQVKYEGISNGMKCPLWRLDPPKASEGRMFNWCYSSFAGAKNTTATHSLYWKISALWSWTQQDTPWTGLFDEETGSTAKDWLQDLALIRELSEKQIKPKKSVRRYHRRCSCELCVPLIRTAMNMYEYVHISRRCWDFSCCRVMSWADFFTVSHSIRLLVSTLFLL